MHLEPVKPDGLPSDPGDGSRREDGGGRSRGRFRDQGGRVGVGVGARVEAGGSEGVVAPGGARLRRSPGRGGARRRPVVDPRGVGRGARRPAARLADRIEAAGSRCGAAIARPSTAWLRGRSTGGSGAGAKARGGGLARPVLDAVERAVHESRAGETPPPLLLVLDQVQDPRNLGACVRSGAAAGANAVVVPRRRSAGLTAAVRRTAAGGAERVPVVEVPNLARALRDLAARGMTSRGPIRTPRSRPGTRTSAAPSPSCWGRGGWPPAPHPRTLRPSRRDPDDRRRGKPQRVRRGRDPPLRGPPPAPRPAAPPELIEPTPGRVPTFPARAPACSPASRW